MRTAERDRLLLLLAITSGSADAWSFIGLGHAFVANMTGNTVLLGISVFSPQHEYLRPIIALVSYAIGVAGGSLLTRHVKPGSSWSKATSGVLFLECLLLSGAEFTWVRVAGAPAPMVQCAILSCVAAGIGLQSGALLPLELPGIITTYITGTWTTLVSGIALVNDDRERAPRDKASLEGRLLIQSVFIAVYFLSAVTATFVFQYQPTMVGGITAAPVLIVAAYSALRG